MNKIIDDVMRLYNATFTPTMEEQELFRKRLSECTIEELKNMQKNFALFGVKEVLKCIYCLRE